MLFALSLDFFLLRIAFNQILIDIINFEYIIRLKNQIMHKFFGFKIIKTNQI